MVIFKILYKKNCNLYKFLLRKLDPNIHQNAPSGTILKNYLGGVCP